MTRYHTILAGTPLYHGSPEPLATEIEMAGFLTGYPKVKMGGGTLDEGGMIWFSRKPEVAADWARGCEAGEMRACIDAGTVFVYVAERNLRLIDRCTTRLNDKADTLNHLLGIPDYKTLRKDDNTDIAAIRATTSGFKIRRYRAGGRGGNMAVIWPIILSVFHADGFEYGREEKTIALAADRLPVEVHCRVRCS